MKTRLSLAAIIVMFLVSACSVFGNSELESARSQWRAASVGHYRYQLRVGCFCPFMDKMPLSIEVNQGQVVSMTYNDGTPVSAEERKMFERYETIDKMFDFTADSIEKADEIHVEYDPTYGFPATVQIDFIKLAVDDELGLSVPKFELLK